MVTRLYDFINGEIADADKVDAELNQILNELNTNVILTTGAQTKAGALTLSDTPKMDAIAEKTAATGVTIDGITLKDDLDTSGIVGKTTAQTLANKTLTSPIFNGSMSGWIEKEAFTYASATTITVASGAASIYQKGDKLKFKQTAGTYKYYYVITVADTLLTVTGGSDYTVLNEAITEPAYSHVENPLGFPSSFNWTPTLTGGNTDLPGYDNATFIIQGSLLFMNFYALNRTLTGTAGFIQISLPVTNLSADITIQCVINNGATFVTTIIAQKAASLDVYKTIALGNWAANETGVNIYISHFYRI